MLGQARLLRAWNQRDGRSLKGARRCTSVAKSKPSTNRPEAPPAQILPHQYLAFYKYARIEDPEAACEDLKSRLETLGGLGRIYVAKEGINAQMSVPVPCYEAWRYTLDTYSRKWGIGEVTMNVGAVASMESEEETPFTKLTVKVRNRIVQDALPLEIDQELDLCKASDLSLHPKDWHDKIANAQQGKEPLIVDCRNYYESQIGLFDGALRLPVDRYSESFEAIDKMLEEHIDKASLQGPQGEVEVSDVTRPKQVDRDILLYCTGGIRCEKIGAYLSQVKGRKNVHTLEGGINRYAKFVSQTQVPSVYKGKNYQFDKRNKFGLETESVTDHKLTRCVGCGRPDDHMRNCINPVCNILLVLCDSCHAKRHGSCSPECERVALMTVEERRAYEQAHEEDTIRLGSLQKFVRSKAYLDEVIKESSAMEYRKKVTIEKKPTSSDSDVPYERLKSFARMEADNKRRKIGSARITPMDTQSYVEKWSSKLSPAFSLLDLKEPRAAISVGPYQGQWIKFVTRMVRAEKVLEIGTFMGYSALCFAEALPENGTVITCDLDYMSFDKALKNFATHPHGHKVQPKLTAGMEVLQEAVNNGNQFDLIFIDADKHNFLNYYNFIFDKKLLSPNGLVIVDNTLWRGEVVSESAEEEMLSLKPSEEGEGALEEKTKKKKSHILHEFNKAVAEDPRTTQVMLPVRDGMTFISWASPDHVHTPTHCEKTGSD